MLRASQTCLTVGLISFIGILAEPSQDQLRLWKNMKHQLMAEDGYKYFETGMKDALIPELCGTVISATPSEHPTSVVLALSDRSSAEVTVRFVRVVPQEKKLVGVAFPGRINRGDEIQFEGIPVHFDQEPFMLTFDVTLDRLTHLAK